MTNPHPGLFVTLSGLPLRIELRWPVHRATSGADYYVLHGRASLDDGSGLLAEVSGNLTLTMAEVLPSLEPEHCEFLAVNAIRKTIDNGQIEFLKSGKLQPVEISTRYFSFKTRSIRFIPQSEELVRQLLLRKVYWLGVAHESSRVWIAEPCDCQYVNHPPETFLKLARALAAEGLLQLEGEFGSPTDALRALQAEYQRQLEHGLARTRASYNPAMRTATPAPS